MLALQIRRSRPLPEVSVAGSRNSNGDFPDLARADYGDGLVDLPGAEADIGPGGGEQHHDSDLSPRQVLVVAKVFDRL